jgi:hypothetical protein
MMTKPRILKICQMVAAAFGAGLVMTGLTMVICIGGATIVAPLVAMLLHRVA